MGSVCWNFPLLGTASESGNNNAAITMFKGSGVMDGLVREICQNSLDAHDRLNHPDDPVIVQFKLFELNRENHTAFDGLKEAFEGAKTYWENNGNSTPDITAFIDNALNCVSQEKIPVLMMSDYNTIGLNGAFSDNGKKSYWNLLVNTEGISGKQDNQSGGSFGIGKNAPFAYSGLSTVFYSTFAQDGGRAFEGVCHFVTTQRKYNGVYRPTMPSGKYLYLINEFTGEPITDEQGDTLASAPEFRRTEIGTDVSIFGFKLTEYPDWEDATAIAALKNFILAIKWKKLVIEIVSPKKKILIDSNCLDKLLNEDYKEESQLIDTRQIYKTVNKVKPIVTKIVDPGDLEIYVEFGEAYRAAASRFRSTGMLIKTDSCSLPHYNVVVVVNAVGSCALSDVLRKSEPPQHTDWNAKYITDNKELHRKAVSYINKIKKEMQNALNAADDKGVPIKMDGGVGGYLPVAGAGDSGAGADGLKIDVKIKQITSNDGQVLYRRNFDTAESAIGSDAGGNGIRTGTKKHKKHKKKRIIPVNPSGGGKTPGIASGQGKVKTVSLSNLKSRTYYLAANKYRLHVVSEKDLDNVYIQYSAGRDDEKVDNLVVKNYKGDGSPRVDVNGDVIGPVSLKAGANTFYVEFENKEIMVVAPVFTMEVKK